MVIEYEVCQVPVSEARKTGRWERKVYFLREGKRRVGPFSNLREAQAARARVEAYLHSRKVAAAHST